MFFVVAMVTWWATVTTQKTETAVHSCACSWEQQLPSISMPLPGHHAYSGHKGGRGGKATRCPKLPYQCFQLSPQVTEPVLRDFADSLGGKSMKIYEAPPFYYCFLLACRLLQNPPWHHRGTSMISHVIANVLVTVSTAQPVYCVLWLLRSFVKSEKITLIRSSGLLRLGLGDQFTTQSLYY